MATKEFYDACILRFNNDTGEVGSESTTKLSIIARKLYIGFQSSKLHKVLPYVEMTNTNMTPTDTFTSDGEGGDYDFTAFSKSSDPNKLLAIQKSLIRVFDSHALSEPVAGTTFTTIIFERLQSGAGQGLFMEGGVYKSVLTFRILIQLTNKNPTTRYA